MTFEYQSQVNMSVVFSQDLAHLLGLQADQTYGSGVDVISERDLNLTSNIRSIHMSTAICWNTFPSENRRRLFFE